MCGHRSEDTIHFVLNCPLHTAPRVRLVQTLNRILNFNFSALSQTDQINLLIHGIDLSAGDGEGVAVAFQHFVLTSNRFPLA